MDVVGVTASGQGFEETIPRLREQDTFRNLRPRRRELALLKPRGLALGVLVRTEHDHKSALAKINVLADAKEGTPEFDRLDVLVTLVEACEAKHYPIGPPSFEAAVEYEMAKRGIATGNKSEAQK